MDHFEHNLHQFSVISSEGSGDADIADLALLLPLPEGRQVGFPITQVVNLHEVHDRNPHEPHGFLHLFDAVLFSVDPDFGRSKESLLILDRFQ